MPRYLLLLILYVPVWALAMLAAPVLPFFAVMREGPLDNAHGFGLAPRLPLWLSWFDTSADNSLWGDEGHRARHPTTWRTRWGMTLWLWRNPAAGFAWSVLAWRIDPAASFDVTGNLEIDKSRPGSGSCLIRSSDGAFQYRRVIDLAFFRVCLEFGWLLDIYVKNPGNLRSAPLAPFSFTPVLRKIPAMKNQ